MDKYKSNIIGRKCEKIDLIKFNLKTIFSNISQ